MAAVTVQCPHCSHSYSVDDSFVGRRARCKHCGMAFALAPSEELDAPDDGRGSAVDEKAAEFVNGWSSSTSIPDRVGRFLIKKRLGAGACGTVYRALDPSRRQQREAHESQFDPRHARLPGARASSRQKRPSGARQRSIQSGCDAL